MSSFFQSISNNSFIINYNSTLTQIHTDKKKQADVKSMVWWGRNWAKTDDTSGQKTNHEQMIMKRENIEVIRP